MFQYLLAFYKDVCPLSITFMPSSSYWFVHLACLDASTILLVLAKFCIDVIALVLGLVVNVESHVLLRW